MPTNPIMLMLLFIYIFLTNLFPCPRYWRCLGTEEMKYRMLLYFALFCYNPKYGHHCDNNMSYLPPMTAGLLMMEVVTSWWICPVSWKHFPALSHSWVRYDFGHCPSDCPFVCWSFLIVVTSAAVYIVSGWTWNYCCDGASDQSSKYHIYKLWTTIKVSLIGRNVSRLCGRNERFM